MIDSPSARAVRQYSATTGNLTARIALHAYGTNPQDWFSWLEPRLPLTGRVLEVGSGTGELWRRVPHAGVRPTLTDFSAAMCARLRSVAGAMVLRCDAGELPFCDGGFDAVIANHMLYHVDDPVAVLRELRRVLRVGRRLAVATNGAGHMAEVDALAAAIGRPELRLWRTHNGFDAAAGPEMVRSVFREVMVERYPCDLVVPSPEPVLAYLGSMAEEPLTSQQAADARRLVASASGTGVGGGFRIRKHTVLITAAR